MSSASFVQGRPARALGTMGYTWCAFLGLQNARPSRCRVEVRGTILSAVDLPNLEGKIGGEGNANE